MYLGENGVKLSGGQKQRVGIARALYKDAHLLLFDEATSALDPDTEKAIVSTINHLAKLNKTIVIVAHRVTTLEMCDRIYELDRGNIKGVYNYNEVFNKLLNN
ncbi:MAG: ATP-binding cassette domain-containing protein [Saprospiraceae bacterium]|nr:ATP-binding cassette domain-containing protein [Saprospiraceae bacterium]